MQSWLPIAGEGLKMVSNDWAKVIRDYFLCISTKWSKNPSLAKSDLTKGLVYPSVNYNLDSSTITKI